MSYVQVAIGVVIRPDGTVLVARRREGDQFARQWEFPGGKVAPSESPTACLHRELDEELGITIRVLAQLAPIAHDYGNLKVCLHPFIASIVSGDPSPIASLELKWVPSPDLSQLDFPAANAPLLAHLAHIIPTLLAGR